MFTLSNLIFMILNVNKKFDYVISYEILDHIPNTEAALKKW